MFWEDHKNVSIPFFKLEWQTTWPRHYFPNYFYKKSSYFVETEKLLIYNVEIFWSYNPLLMMHWVGIVQPTCAHHNNHSQSTLSQLEWVPNTVGGTNISPGAHGPVPELSFPSVHSPKTDLTENVPVVMAPGWFSFPSSLLTISFSSLHT